VQRIADGARAGDLTATKLFVYLLPRPPKYNPQPINLPLVTSVQEALAQIAAVNQKMLAGEIDLDTTQVAVANLRTFLAAALGPAFEVQLKQLERLVYHRDDSDGDSDRLNGKSTTVVVTPKAAAEQPDW
jgi:hypothetical protein